MTSEILFIAGSLLCFIFLAAVYGDSLRWPLLLEGRWVAALFRVPERLLQVCSEAAETVASFVLGNLSWVLAATAGCTGLGMTLFSLGIGIAADATGWQRDAVRPMNAGGVLDEVAELSVRSQPGDRLVSRADRDESLLILQQQPNAYRVFSPPPVRLQRPFNRPDLLPGNSGSRLPYGRTQGPDLQITFQRLGTRSQGTAAQMRSIRGSLVEPFPEPFVIGRAVRRLVPGGWEAAVASLVNEGRRSYPLVESNRAEVDSLESSIRILPGPMVTSQDLRVIRLLPEEAADGDVRVRISLTNLGSGTIDGLLVRELLPSGTVVVSASSSPTLRDDVLTWLVEGLVPREERILQFTAQPDAQRVVQGDTVFESITEVSAILAVSSVTRVTGGGRGPGWQPAPPSDLPPLPSARDPLPRVAGQAVVRMEITEPPVQVAVGEWARVMFRLENSGTAAADNLRILLNLDSTLEHADLIGRPNEKVVEVSIARLEPGASRLLRLEVRPVEAGNSRSTAELLLDDEQLDLQIFRIGAAELPADGRAAPR